MNKKLLGIAAVALLGVSAAFAATTSTVYFTASGTLTKFIESQIKDKETSTDKGSGNHDSDNGIACGVSYVETSLTLNSTTSLTAEKKYNGDVESTDSACTVQYSTYGKVSTGIDTNIAWNNPSYVYHEIILNNLEFSKAGDYLLLPVAFYNATSNIQYFNTLPYKTYVKGDFQSFYNLTAKSNSYSNLFTIRLGTNDEIAKYGESVSSKCDGYNERGQTMSVSFQSNNYGCCYLYIELKADVSTTDDNLSLTIELPGFQNADPRG